jgi:hypothetical protein
VPNFGVNICPFNYGIKVIYSEIDSNRQHLQIESVQHLFSLPAIHRSLRPDPNPRSSFPQAQIHPHKLHSALPFRFLPQISPPPFLNRSFPPSF